ncbi:hypothetical protein EV580_1372 [Mycobacterium sp. BK086]|uniref:hypothetical protein n=1 Tax=Mycobacterium sp. BK086 TaxID=2512165 RepID=UPI00105CB6AA|nr:hypothetical protein [Mycobacterium sp. BK086]TDO18188.1 hypothetical protein EV580_1372 [Mycobacterium sp. BK086]
MLGLIALIASIVGFVFACFPGALIVGWVLLPIALILGIVGVCLSGQTKGTSVAAIIVSIVGMVVGAVVFLTLVSHAFSDAFGKSDFTPSAGSGATETENNARAREGSRDNPFPIGQEVTSRDWQITLGQPREAGTQVAAENRFNDEPEPGMEYWIVPVTATYVGEKTGNLIFGVRIKFVGADNRTYDDDCGVLPNPLSDVGDLYPGGTAKGNVCVAVPSGADGLWTLTTGIGDPAFFKAN